MQRAWKLAIGFLTASLLLISFWNALPAAAANPTTMSFQGKVVNANGTNVADGTYGFVFKLYNVSTAGTALWTETQSTVAVTAGIFQVSLGSVCPLQVANACNNNTPIDFSTSNSLYLGMTFNGDAAGEMSPRVQMQSVPYAFNADTANKLGGLTAGQFVQLSPGAQQSGSLSVSGSGTFGNGLNITGTSLFGGRVIETFAAATNDTAATFNVSNTNASATAATVNAQTVSLVGATNGTTNANTINGIKFTDVSALANNTFNGLSFGTGYTNLIQSANLTLAANGNLTAVGAAFSGPLTNTSTYNGNTFTATSLALSGAGANTINGALNQALTIQSLGTGQLTLDSGSNVIGIQAGVTTLQKTAAGSTTIELNDAGTTTLIVKNNGSGVANLNLFGGSLQTGATPTTRLDNAGNLVNIGNYTSSGSLTGGVTSDIRATETAAATYTEAAATLAYDLSANSGTTAASFTTTFNITGLPAVDGTEAFITATTIKGVTGVARQHTVVVQIAGTTVSTVATTSQTATDTTSRSFIVMRLGGVWRVFGSGLTATPTITNSTVNTADFAEYIPYAGAVQPQPGELLSAADAAGSVSQSAGRYDHRVLGVVSTDPFQVAGADDGHSVIIALTGRVPVRVNLENGVVAPGDRLTASSTPGVAMKATKAGRVIGTALGFYDGSQAEALVSLQLAVGYDDPSSQEIISDTTTTNGGLQLEAGQLQTVRLDKGSNSQALKSGSQATAALATLSGGAAAEPTIASPAAGNVPQLPINDGLVAETSAQPSPTAATLVATEKSDADGFQLRDAAGRVVATISQTGQASFDSLRVGEATISGDLVVAGDTTFAGLSTFEKLATFIGKSVFRRDVQFDGHLTVSNSTAGYASLRPGETTVHVSFVSPYSSLPIVSASPTDGHFMTLSVNNVTARGFDLSVPVAPTSDTKFAWTALAVSDPQSSSNPVLVAPPKSTSP